jgi:hypothetical protein
LGQLFLLLDAPEREKRFNALAVLKMFLARDVSHMSTSTRAFLAQHLLSRLGDEELVFRTMASTLFAKLDQRVVVPALCDKLAAGDTRVRTAAERFRRFPPYFLLLF